jgi:hypothetical protein
MYVTAQDYAEDHGTGKKWLTRGITEIRTVLGYSGALLSGQSIHLVLLAGVEFEPAMALISDLGATRVSIGYAPEELSVNPEISKKNRDVAVRLKLSVSAPVSSFAFSCVDALEAFYALKKLVGDAGQEKIVVAPLSNKVSAIGLFLLCQENPSIQVQYVRPMDFNRAGYCAPGGDLIMTSFTKNDSRLVPAVI